MALVKKLSNRFGTTTEYWRVDTITLNNISQNGTAMLLGYVNQKQRKAGKEPVDNRSFSWQKMDYAFPLVGVDIKDMDGKIIDHIDGLNEKNPFELAYQAIKNKKTIKIKDGREIIIPSEFSDAVDMITTSANEVKLITMAGRS